jgi:hypothetical protein
MPRAEAQPRPRHRTPDPRAYFRHGASGQRQAEPAASTAPPLLIIGDVSALRVQQVDERDVGIRSDNQP